MTNIESRYNMVKEEFHTLKAQAGCAMSMARTAQREGWDEDARKYMSAFRVLSAQAKSAHAVMGSMLKELDNGI
jgi:hypothetical protein